MEDHKLPGKHDRRCPRCGALMARVVISPTPPVPRWECRDRDDPPLYGPEPNAIHDRRATMIRGVKLARDIMGPWLCGEGALCRLIILIDEIQKGQHD